MNILKLIGATAILFLTACATTETVNHCEVSLKAPLRGAMTEVENKLTSGCGPYYQGYVADLIRIATDNPDPDNKRAFSDLLISLSDRGVISKRQAAALYNRYFNIKFVSLTGDYSTCSQVCPTREKVMLDMRQELLDKEVGLLKASNDAASYYRADMLLKESELVLEATCQACAGGAAQ